ncbi:unnamed protein product [Brachionus calyciflorus]|uniref:Uncharacterized protein n=1 Tax=Brachionus calyciflorus TaxID=104777 RepID=A0A813M3F8_9BILA|nr:unnamed protein product [Brachionus calyciflorus]
MKISIPITLAIACLSISLAFIIITFILENWLLVKNVNHRYGMWRACRGNSSTCFNWYVDGETEFKYRMTDSYKAFQALQSCMLGLIVVTLVSLFFNLKICERLLAIFIIDAVLIFLATCCGLVSLIVFGVNVYNANIYILDWCFWLSVAALALVLIGLLFLVTFTISLSIKSSHSDSFMSNLIQSPRDMSQINLETYEKQAIENPKQEANQQNVKIDSFKKSSHFVAKTNNAGQTPNAYKRDPQNMANMNKASSPRFQKNTPTQNESRLRSRTEAKISDDEKNQDQKQQKVDSNDKRRPSRNYWNNKNKLQRPSNRAQPKEKTPSKEQYKAGYSSEPDIIEYSLDRSWLSANNLNNSMPILDENDGLTGTFNSRHFVKLPKLVYYDGSNHYSRANIKF